MKKNGQSTLEYAVIIAVVVGGLLAMQIYMKRGVQGKLRESTDRIGEQYSAGNTVYKYTTEQVGDMETRETFGRNDDNTAFLKGISNFKVVNPAEVKRTATGADAEKIDKKLGEEKVIE